MGIPLTLSEVPDQTPYIQYVASNGQTVYPYPFAITQDSDLVVIINGTALATDAGYTLSGQGNPTGGNVTLTSGSTAGDIVTLFRDVPIERLTQFGQNSGFSSTAFNAEFNNLYLIAQQLEVSVGLCLQVPNTNPDPVTLLTPASYANKYLAFDSNGNPTPAALTSTGTITQSLFNGFLGTASAASANALAYKAGTLSVSGFASTFIDATSITMHAIYSFIAQPNIDYRGGDPVYGHAAFADFSAIIGTVSSDHSHGFQASTQYSNSGTIGRLGGFYSRQDVSGTGVVTEMSHFRCDDVTEISGGSAAVENQYGFYCGALSRGVGNYAFYSVGSAPSVFGGPVLLGVVQEPATVQYEGVSGNLQLIPRNDTPNTYFVHVMSKLLIGGGTTVGSEAFAASILNDPGTETLIITPRSGGGTKIAGGPVEIVDTLKVDFGLGVFGTTPPGQPTGYGTPTGGSHQASFSAGAITLANLAAAVAQLIIDLKSYGIVAA